jgi:hypothetical protein
MPSQRPAVNTQTKVLDTTQGRLLCIADIRGNISHLNTLAAEANAQAIIHTGDFGFIGKNVLFHDSFRSFLAVAHFPVHQMPTASIGSVIGQYIYFNLRHPEYRVWEEPAKLMDQLCIAGRVYMTQYHSIRFNPNLRTS